MSKIWVTGDAVVDLIPDGENHYLKCAGGAPANVAVGVARLGRDAGFIGRVGFDPLGKFMQETLNAENVSTEHMILDPNHRTSTVIVGLDNGERSFTFMVNPSADQFLEVGDLPPFQAGDFLHCCSIALIHEPSRSTTIEAIRRIKGAGGFFSFDPNLRDSLWPSLEEMKTVVNQVVAMADILKFSEEELQQTKNMLKNSALLSQDRQNALLETTYLSAVLGKKFLRVDEWLEVMENVKKEDIVLAANTLKLQAGYFMEGK